MWKQVLLSRMRKAILKNGEGLGECLFIVLKGDKQETIKMEEEIHFPFSVGQGSLTRVIHHYLWQDSTRLDSSSL